MAERTVKITIVGDEKSAVAALQGTERAAGTLETRVSGLGGTLGGFGSVAGTALGGLAVAGVGGLALLGGAVVKTGIDFNAMQQQATIAFTTMLGDGQKAETFLQGLQAFAASTPFEFPELVGAAQKMLAFGFEAEQVVPMMTDIGNAAAGLGLGAEGVSRITTALGQMQVKGKATGEEMAQLTESGIAGWTYLAEALGVSVPEAMDLVSKGAVDAETVIGAVRAGMQRDFGGMMEAQSRSFSGLLSTLQDTFAQVSGQVMGPLFEVLTQGLQQLSTFLASPEFAAGVQAFSQGLVLGFQQIGMAVQLALPYLMQFGGFLQTAFTTIAPLVMQLATVLQGAVLGALTGLQGALGGIVAGFGGWSGLLQQLQPLWASLQQLWTAAQPILTVLGAIIGGVLVAALGFLLANLGGLVGFFTGILPGAIQFVTGLVQALTGVFNLFAGTIQGIVATVVALFHGDWAGAMEAMRGISENAVNSVKQIFGGLATAIMGLIEGLVGGVIGLISGWVNTIVGFFQGLYQTLVGGSIVPDMVNAIIAAFANLASTVIGAITTWVSDLIGKFASLASDALAKAEELRTNVTTAITTLASEALTTVTTWASDVVSKLGSLASDALAKANELKTNVVNAIQQAATDGLSKLGQFVTDVGSKLGEIAGAARDAVGDLGGVLVQAGRDLIQGLIDGIASMIQSLKNTLGGITSLLPDWKGPAAVDRRILEPSGRLVMQGFADGLRAGAGDVQRTLGGVTGALPAAAAGGGRSFAAGGNTYVFQQPVYGVDHFADLVAAADRLNTKRGRYGSTI